MRRVCPACTDEELEFSAGEAFVIGLVMARNTTTKLCRQHARLRPMRGPIVIVSGRAALAEAEGKRKP